MTETSFDLIIIGGGAAGFTAGIYAARAGLRATVLDEGMGGGQAATSPWVENYPGFEGISGMDLMMKMKEHAAKNLPVEDGVHVDAVVRDGEHFIITAGERKLKAKSVILATGAKFKKIGVPGESKYIGSGVSYCATCDGMFFRGKKVAVIGGGNNGATEALHLKHIGADVTLIHRRDTLRAEKVLQEQLVKDGIKLLLDMQILEILGDTKVIGLWLHNKKTGQEETHEFDGVFVSVGVEANADLAKSMGIELNGGGFIKTDRKMRTSVGLVYAAGDVSGGLRQVITACAGGAVAAMSAYEDVRTPYWA
ncbi:MAG: FAD-dependent oxidoreductase [Candidatus Thermoplasmatota archaeon]|nr:FAD-binding protein [Euryarchaeota archaeon]MBU4032112.1 FAD-dependent oxidoreductase [Candidatus Thermoplasmatota archaeon]MBU4071020.1 FAD-dependent oxidoreductase [Candidatus Thermoplasmatota archaeon]MBU4144879.1 FAD-dependent oxidoreductase [Candidatus Thermoplasmatota archaeon]MBU4592658.1 FAD-dependent oxidoreductase [Candidatus Thermoplasmatota archaeon]